MRSIIKINMMKSRVDFWARRMMACVICSVFAVCVVWAERVSLEDASVVANNFMNVSSASSALRKAPAKRMVKKSTEQQEASYYIYENADGEGWVMVAANDAVNPILAFSETGHFRTDNMPENLKGWLGKYNTFSRRLEADSVEATPEAVEEWSRLRRGARRLATSGTVVVGPLVQTTWDQEAPYWNLCPGTGNNRAYTGCVATAMAQVMNYWKWPKQGTGSHTYQPLNPNTGRTSSRYGQQTANFEETTYDWDNMLNDYSDSYTTAQATAVATLMFHCGVATEMMYGNDADGGSGTYTVNYGSWDENDNAQNALYHFFGYKQPTGYMRDGYTYGGYTYYQKWTDEDWTAMIKAELDAERPIMYAGASSEGGHSFICDGYRSDDYFHFNWGWSGYADGYFLLSNLVPGGGGAGGGGYSFSEDQDVIIGIEPASMGHAVVKNGSGCTIAGAMTAENDKVYTATFTPTDDSYDFSSVTVALGSTTLTKGTHYTLSADNKTLTILASAITGDIKNSLIITVVWAKARYRYAMLSENCSSASTEGMVSMSGEPLELTIMPKDGYMLDNPACWDVDMDDDELTYGTDFTYNAATGLFRIASVSGDVKILAYGKKEVVWKVGSVEFDATYTDTQSYGKKDIIHLPADEPESCSDKVFVGWCWIADYESATTAPGFAQEGDVCVSDTYYAVFADEQAGEAVIEDVLTVDITDATSSYYTSWSGKQLTSDAVYAGQSAKGSGAIQLRSKNSNSGIITTASGGTVNKITVDWNSATSVGKALDVYGKNKAYSAPSDLYGAINKGTKLGSIVYGTSTELTVDGEYTYIGLRSNSGTIYLNSVTVAWNGTGVVYSNYTTHCADERGIENTLEQTPAANKVLRDGRLMIIRGEAVYTPTGARIQ